MAECCFTSTETVDLGLLGTGAQVGHLNFHTTPELCYSGVICGGYMWGYMWGDMWGYMWGLYVGVICGGYMWGYMWGLYVGVI